MILFFVKKCKCECKERKKKKKVEKVGGEIFPKHHTYPTPKSPLLSSFAAPKVFSLILFSWLHQIRSPAPLSLLLFPLSLFFFLFSSFASTRQPSLSHQNKISLSKEEIKGLILKFQLQIVGGK